MDAHRADGGRVDRRRFLRYSGAVAGLAVVSPRTLASCRPKGLPKPNILVVTADDMRADHLPYMPKTLASFTAGATFTSCRLNVNACQPSRVGFLTGQYALRNGCYATTDYMADPTQSLGPWMQEAGYTTAVIGKYPFAFGGTPLAGWSVQRTLRNLTELSAYGYGVFDGTTTTHPSQHQVDYIFEEAVNFVSSAAKPWFCWVTPTNPHTPLDPKPEHQDDWLDVEWPIVDDDLTGKPSWMQDLPRLTEVDRESIRDQARLQLQELSAVDDGVAALFSALGATGQLVNTIVIFTSDNGVMYGEHHLWGFFPSVKTTPYEPSLRVPLLAIGPGFTVGEVSAAVTGQDLTATILAVAGYTPPVPLDGIDLRQTPPADRHLLHERSGATPPVPGMPGGVGVSTATRKLWRHDAEDPDRYEMYLLDTDPHELVNVAYDPAYLDERNELEAALDALLA